MSPRLAFSPCPNDTFIFHALVHGLVPDAPTFEVTYADVDITNGAAQRGEFDLVKVSYGALPWLLDDYELLPCGGALGRGCGPLILTRDGAGGSRRRGVAGMRVAVPGERTTAYLLLRLWSRADPPASVTVVPFAEIMPAVAAGTFDAGLVIHEARFTYHRYGLRALVDLGEWWEAETGLPIPLGAIVARRRERGGQPPARARAVNASEPRGRERTRHEARAASAAGGRELARRGAGEGVDPVAAAEWIRASVRHAWADPAASRDYVLAHAQEMEPDVVERHIGLYVNRFSEDLGDEGYAAVNALLGRCAAAGLTPPARPLSPPGTIRDPAPFRPDT